MLHDYAMYFKGNMHYYFVSGFQNLKQPLRNLKHKNQQNPYSLENTNLQDFLLFLPQDPTCRYKKYKSLHPAIALWLNGNKPLNLKRAWFSFSLSYFYIYISSIFIPMMFLTQKTVQLSLKRSCDAIHQKLGKLISITKAMILMQTFLLQSSL